jgi:hypothetical protein
MKNLKFLLLTLVLFVFMVPVKAMPCYSVHKTETVFNKQPELISVVFIDNIQKEVLYVCSRAIVPLFPFSEAYKPINYESRQEIKHITNEYQFLKNKTQNNFLLENLPDKKNQVK